MGLFDKKYCSVCEKKIGLLGNRKLEDGNLCKDCANKLSPWFSERRQSSVNDIRAQLAYREENRGAVAQFNTTRSLGKHTKLLLDENAGKLVVTAARDLREANPDVLDFSQITGCDLDIEESRHELKDKDAQGRLVSFNPPRYEYSYNFYVSIRVNHPYFDQIRYSLSNGYIKTGERVLANAPGGWQVSRRGAMDSFRVREYYDCLNTGNEIKDLLDDLRQSVREKIVAQNAPKTAVICPLCGASTLPDANGCCEFCGGAVGQ
ncbi:MAG: DUF4428 domain-containing protein [Oscillospiraceae bacterium]|nr:DUF4428 domain-containing protein [Oscillospiraceae bacterium]